MKRMEIEVEFDDGRTQVVKIHNRSLVAFDETRARRKWAAADEAPMLWQTFIAWHSLMSSGSYGEKFEIFREVDCVALQIVDQAGDPIESEGDLEDVDPTPPEAEPDYSSS